MTHSSFDQTIAAPRQGVLEVAPETFLIRALTASIGATWTSLNSMLIRAAEPVIVDTGMVTNRAAWFDDVFSLVDPGDVRWIFVTHNDSDHSGNLVEALERCPNAHVVTSPGESYRTWAAFGIPFDRIRIVETGEAFDVGDRTLRAIRPPVYDSPYTRGLLDEETRVFYSSDAFCAPMPAQPVDWVDEMPAQFWSKGMAEFYHLSLCPWIAMADQAKFTAEVAKLAGADIDVIVGAHTAPLRGSTVAQAFARLTMLPAYVPEQARR